MIIKLIYVLDANLVTWLSNPLKGKGWPINSFDSIIIKIKTDFIIFLPTRWPVFQFNPSANIIVLANTIRMRLLLHLDFGKEIRANFIVEFGC